MANHVLHYGLCKAIWHHEKCLNNLGNIKQGDGFCCLKCEIKTWRKTKICYISGCNKWKHKDFDTIFNKCKFEITKAFMSIFW